MDQTLQAKPKRIADLLPHGALTEIGRKLGLSRQAVSIALSKARPGHPAVVEALRMARESGSLTTAQDIVNLTASNLT